MFNERRVSSLPLVWGWIALTLLAAGGIFLAGPAASRIALLSKSHGLVLDYGSLYAIVAVAVAFATMLLIHWHLAGSRGLTDLEFDGDQSTSSANNGRRIAILGAYGLMAILASYLVLIQHGGTLIATMEHDTFVYYDGAHRIDAGQAQHIDFHTPMGFFCNVLPYWGLKLAGGYAGSLEISALITAAFFVATGVAVLATRFAPVVSVPVLLFLCLLTVVPLGVDEYPEEISHSMFYNRFGWVGVTLVFLMFVEPRNPQRLTLWLDSICLAALLFFLFYLKITYFLVSAAFLGLLFVFSPYSRKVVLLAFGMFVPAAGLIELIYGINGPYARDILMAIRSSGANRGGMIPKLFGNFKDFLIVALAVCLALPRGGLRLSFLAYVGFVALAGVAIIDQNTHSRGVICWLAVLATVYEVIRRHGVLDRSVQNQSTTRIACLMSLGLLLLFVAQQMVFRGAAAGIIRSAVNQVDVEMPGGLQRIVFTEQMQELNLPKRKTSAFDSASAPGALEGSDEAGVTYLQTVLDGVNLLESAGVEGKSVTALDFVNPFPFILGTPPPKGGHTCIHYGRTMNDTTYSPAEELLGDSDLIIVPRVPRVPLTTEFLVRTYKPYMEENFQQSAQSKYWTLWSRKEAAKTAD